MLRPELYERTVNILVQTYYKDKLFQGDCHSCAVGSIICANMGGELIISIDPIDQCKIYKWSNGVEPVWTNVFVWGEAKGGDTSMETRPDIRKQINSTGYTWRELMEIEKAFELGTMNKEVNDKSQFDGLMAVVECLDKIHENHDTQVTTNSKNKFTKNLQTV